MAENGQGDPLVQPWDRYNQELVARVHPPDWRNPQPAPSYNLVVVGGGTAGLVCAAGAAGLGAKVALVERHLLGGDCLNFGCVPSKALLSAAKAAATVKGAGSFGVQGVEGAHSDFGRVMARMRRLRAEIASNDSAARFQALGVDVFIGDGAFVDGRTLDVAGARLRFQKALIATGARPAAPAIPGLEQVDYLTNESLFSLSELPPRMAIVGAGAIGCEIAQAFARFGSQVILIENLHGLLPKEERDAAQIVQQALERDGMRLLCCGRDLSLSPVKGDVRLRIESHGYNYDETVEELLVAVGRSPNIEGLGLESAGVAYDRKGVTVNDFLQTSNPRIYAAGDVCSRYQFTHAADFMARLVIRNALFFGRARFSALTIPWCTYTDPEIARVGLSAQQAEERGIAIDTFERPLAEIDRARLDERTEGIVRVHVRRGTDRILGATVVAANAGDLIAPLTQAMTHKLGLKKLADTVQPYPTQAEAIRQLGDLYNRSRLTPRTKTLFTRLMAWRR